MELADLVVWIFLALLIGWVGLVLFATWMQVREETMRLQKTGGEPPLLSVGPGRSSARPGRGRPPEAHSRPRPPE